MDKVFCLSEELNNINVNNYIPYLKVGNALSLLKQTAKNFSNGVVEVVILEKDFKSLGSDVVSVIKSQGLDVKLFIIEGKNSNFHLLKSSFDNSVGSVVAVGDSNLLSTVRYLASITGINCYAVPTTPYLERLFSQSIHLETSGLPAEISAPLFTEVFVDEELISKAKGSSFAESYLSVMGKLTALIDYKLNAFLSNENINDELFNIVKKAINKTAVSNSYKNYKSVIIYSQLLLCMVNSVSDVLKGSGVETVEKCLSLFAPEISAVDSKWIAFQKTAKIYHMYFSNDFSNFLSVPDYESDLSLLEEVSGHGKSYFYKNLKIPSEKRRNLINLLMKKTGENFKKETSLILSLISAVKKNYQKLDNNFIKKPTISYKQIKNAVTLSPYLTNKTQVLTLCRDAGILKCAN